MHKPQMIGDRLRSDAFPCDPLKQTVSAVCAPGFLHEPNGLGDGGEQINGPTIQHSAILLHQKQHMNNNIPPPLRSSFVLALRMASKNLRHPPGRSPRFGHEARASTGQVRGVGWVSSVRVLYTEGMPPSTASRNNFPPVFLALIQY